jgi:hypothetical protein
MRRRRSEEAVPHPLGQNDLPIIYKSPLEELHAWLMSNFNDGCLVPLIDAQNHWNTITKTWSAKHGKTETNIRCDVLRRRLESKYPGRFHFETVNKREGTFIALNDISHYSRSAMSATKSFVSESSNGQPSSFTVPTLSDQNRTTTCDTVFNTVRLLRNHRVHVPH